MGKPKYKHGEWMGVFTDSEPENFIKGHVSEKEAQEITLKALRDEQCDQHLNIKVTRIIHQNGRFGIGRDEYGEFVSWLYLNRPTGERGSFPITMVHYTVDIY